MSRNSSARTCLTPPEFLAALERSGVLPDAKWREVQDRFVRNGSRRFACPGRSAHRGRDAHRVSGPSALEREEEPGLRPLCLARPHRPGRSRGRVFKARHRLMDRVVALKVFLPDARLSKTAVSRFFREMKIVALLDHPNVVRAIDADVHEGCPYIVMEYLEGDDLEHVFARRGPLPPDEVIEYMAQAARGLAHAHEKGVIHRDVKPTNLFLAQYRDREGARPRIRRAGRDRPGRRATSSIPTKASWSGRPISCRPSRSRIKRSMPGPTSSVSAARCTACSRASMPSPA